MSDIYKKMITIEKFKNFLKNRHSEDIDRKVRVLIDYINGKSTDIVPDEFVDFSDTILHNPTRWESFGRYILYNYNPSIYKRVFDIGCGPLMDLSKYLINAGYDITSIDPRLINPDGVRRKKDYFIYGKTDISSFDLLIGLEPCDATEHIMKSAIESHIPFCIALCVALHKAINGQDFKSFEEWYNYLLEESKGEATVIKDAKVFTKRYYILKDNYKNNN